MHLVDIIKSRPRFYTFSRKLLKLQNWSGGKMWFYADDTVLAPEFVRPHFRPQATVSWHRKLCVRPQRRVPLSPAFLRLFRSSSVNRRDNQTPCNAFWLIKGSKSKGREPLEFRLVCGLCWSNFDPNSGGDPDPHPDQTMQSDPDLGVTWITSWSRCRS